MRRGASNAAMLCRNCSGAKEKERAWGRSRSRSVWVNAEVCSASCAAAMFPVPKVPRAAWPARIRLAKSFASGLFAPFRNVRRRNRDALLKRVPLPVISATRSDAMRSDC